MKYDYDAIVVGSGISGGWAAKELTEKGLKVLLLERGKQIEHKKDYHNEWKNPWDMPFKGSGDQAMFNEQYPVQSKGRYGDEYSIDHFVNDKENPYQTTETEPFQWRRSYQTGGRSLVWGRQCYRWSDIDFESNLNDGHGVDWPIRYADIAPWYDHVESFIGVSGAKEGLAQLPDGQFQKPMPLMLIEQNLREALQEHMPERRLTIGRTANLSEAVGDRSPCQNRSICARGCSFGAYFSTQSSTLPAAVATGNLTLMNDALVDTLDYDEQKKRVSGVNVIHTQQNKRKKYTARLVFLCAGSVNSVALLLRSQSKTFPNGLANSSGVLGKYFMDHANTLAAAAVVPGFEDHYYDGNRPTGIVVARFRNIKPESEKLGFTRGYSYQGGAFRQTWVRGKRMAGLGKDYKNELKKPGPWVFALTVFAESIPQESNRITLSDKKDQYGIPQVHIAFKHGENEHAALADAAAEAKKMLALIGGHVVASSDQPNFGGTAVHEMGGARMGKDPKTSVLNKYNQAHDVANLFVTDGAAMASSASQNPSLTYMALTARAVNYAVEQLKTGNL
jgi:choline dehydrogenase-like flavoprotein